MSPLSILRDAAIAIAVSSAVAIAFNTLRPQGLEFVASSAYEVFVPCPEPVGKAEPIHASKIRWGTSDEWVLDARSSGQHEQWHPEGVRSVPFDFLLPVADGVLHMIAQGRPKRVVVIGDGLVPDTGEQLARELNGLGIKNVYYVPGGMMGVRKQLAEGDRDTP